MRAYVINVETREIENLILVGLDFNPPVGRYLLSANDFIANPGDKYVKGKHIPHITPAPPIPEAEILRAQIAELQEQIKILNPAFESKVNADAIGK